MTSTTTTTAAIGHGSDAYCRAAAETAEALVLARRLTAGED